MPTKETFEQRNGTREGASWTDAERWVREQIHYVDDSDGSSEHQREMAFLRHLMLYDDSEERHVMEDKLAGAERNERCSRRAVWLMVVLSALAVVGLGYATLFLPDFPPNRSQFAARIFCALGLASLVSFLAFAGFWIVSRGKLEEQRDACRRLVMRIVESRLGKPVQDSATELVRKKSLRSGVAAEKSSFLQHQNENSPRPS